MCRFTTLKQTGKRSRWLRTVYTLIGIMTVAAAAMGSSAVGAAGETVRVGVYQNKPKIFIDEYGQPGGFFLELIEAIAQQEGWTLHYVPCEWTACLLALEEGRIDLMPDVASSPEREEKYDFHQTPVIESWSQVYENRRTSAESLAELAGKRVAVLEGSVQQAFLEQTMSGFGFAVDIVPVQSLEQAFALASNDEVDAAIANHFFGDYYYLDYGLVKTPIVFNLVNLYYATAQGRNSDLLAAIERWLSTWRKEAGSPYYTVLSHWAEKPPVYLVPQYVGWALGIGVGLLAVAGGMILLLRSQVQARTRHLAEANACLLYTSPSPRD